MSTQRPSAAATGIGDGPRRHGGRAVAVFLVGAIACFVVPPLAAGVFTDQGPAVLVAVAVVELVASAALVRWWLRRHDLRWSTLGWSGWDQQRWLRDALLAVATVVPRLALEMWVFIPAAGGADNEGVREVLANAGDGVTAALAATLFLGVVGGGIAEELYFRGFMLGSVPRSFVRPHRATVVLSVVSVLLFAALHLPVTAPDVASILLAGTTYAGLFLATGRVLAPMLAHAAWNVAAVLAVLAVYG